MENLLTYNESLILNDILEPLSLVLETNLQNKLYDISSRDKDDPLRIKLDDFIRDIESKDSEDGKNWSDSERKELNNVLNSLKDKDKDKDSNPVKYSKGIEESIFDKIIRKVKKYAKRGLLSTVILSSLLSVPGLSQAQSSEIKDIAGIHTQTDTKDNTKQEMEKEAKKVDGVVGVGISSRLSVAKSKARMDASSKLGEGTFTIKDSKIHKEKLLLNNDGTYTVYVVFTATVTNQSNDSNTKSNNNTKKSNVIITGDIDDF